MSTIKESCMKTLFSLVVALCAVSASVAETFYWYDVDRLQNGDFNGCFNDGAHWFSNGARVGSSGLTVLDGTSGTVPYGGANMALFQFGTGWTVTFPTDVSVYTNYAKFHINTEPGTKRTFDGTGATFAHPYNEAGDYPYQSQMQISWRQNATSGGKDILMTMNNSGTVVGGGDYKNNPSFEFTDFKFYCESPASTKDMKIVFEKGTYNFLNPCGVNWNKSTSFPCVYFFGGNYTTSTFPLDKNEVVFEENSTLKANVLAIQGSNAPTNIFQFKGGEHLISTVDFASRFNGWGINPQRSVIDFRVDDGAKVQITNSLNMLSNTSYPTSRVARVIVTGGSELELSTITANYGHGEIHADGGKVTIGTAGLYNQNIPAAANVEQAYERSFRLVAENGGELVMDHGGNGTGLAFGSPFEIASLDHHLVVDNASLTMKPNSKINVYGARIDVRNGGVVDNAGTLAVRGSDNANSIPTVMTIDGGTVTNHSNGMMNIGAGAAGASLVLTNGAMLVYRSGGVTTVSSGDVHMDASSIVDNGGQFILAGVAGENHEMVLDGTVFTNSASAKFNIATAGEMRLVITNSAFLSLGETMYTGGDSSKTTYDSAADSKIANIDMYGGKIVQSDGVDGRAIQLGYQAGSKGIFNLYDGEIRLFKSGTSGNSFNCGVYGCGELNVYGGVLDCFRLRVASNSTTTYDYSSAPESVLRIFGGEVICRSQGNGAWVGFSVGGGDGYANNVGSTVRKARLVLNGGTLTSYTTYGGASAQNRGGTGWAALEADGGTIRPLSAYSPCMLFHFDEAKLGPKGLTVDARGFNNTLAQHVWTNKDGEQGMLRFVGKGSTTVTGNVEQVSYIVADGGTVKLQNLGGNALDTLVTTNGGTVCLNANQRLSIKDFRDDGTGRINILDGCAAGNSYQPFVFESEPSAEAQAALALMVNQGHITGLGNGLAAELTFTEGAGGTYVATMAVREIHDIVIPLEAGAVSNATENVFCSGFDTIIADVGEGAALTLSGTYQYGPFKLIGGGKASFDGLADHLYETFIAKYGVLEVTGPGAQTWDGQLTLNQNSTNDIFIVKNDVDLTMPCPTGSDGNGELVKRGAGTLTLTVGAGETKTLASGYGKGIVGTSYGVWGTDAIHVNQLEYDAQSGMIVNSGVPAFLISEGELRIVGEGEGAKVNVGGICDVGISTRTGTVQPGLVLDNVFLHQTKWPNNWFFLGHGINSAAAANPHSGDFAKAPYVELTNNATLKCSQFEIGRLCAGTDVKARLVVDGSTFNPVNWFAPGEADTQGQKPEIVFRNGSKLYTRSILLRTDLDIDFDNTVIANSEFESTLGLLPIKIAPLTTVSVSSFTGTYNFRNKSVFHCNVIDPRSLNVAIYRPLTLNFDDSTWIPTNQVMDFTFEWPVPERVLIAVTNIGLHLPVPAASTWTMNQPVKGTGGVVMDGEGTLKFGSGAVAYTGVTRLDSGTVDLSSAGDVAALTISGGGTLKDATVGALTLQTAMEDGEPVSVPTLDGVTARRRTIDFQGQLSEAEVKALSNVVIGHYAGTEPGGAKWRIVGTPLTNARGQVAYENGDIVLQSVSAGPGAVFTFR